MNVSKCKVAICQIAKVGELTPTPATMTTAGYRGTSVEQDPRFAEKQKKLMQATKFPAVFKERIVMSKVALDVVK